MSRSDDGLGEGAELVRTTIWLPRFLKERIEARCAQMSRAQGYRYPLARLQREMLVFAEKKFPWPKEDNTDD